MTTVFRWMIDWASDSDPTSMTTVFLSSNPMDDRMHDHDGSGRAAEQRAGPKKTIEFILIKDLAARCSAAQPEPLCILSSIEKQQSSKSGPSRRPSLSSIGHRSRVQVVFVVGSESAAQASRALNHIILYYIILYYIILYPSLLPERAAH